MNFAKISAAGFLVVVAIVAGAITATRTNDLVMVLVIAVAVPALIGGWAAFALIVIDSLRDR